MGFLDFLFGHRAVQAEGSEVDREERRRRARAHWGLDRGGIDLPEEPTASFDAIQWRKKVKRVLDELPGSEPQWPTLMAEARSLSLDPAWIATTLREEFTLLIRRVVADCQYTETEHRTLELARTLTDIPEDQAEAILREVVAEAESFFGKPVEGT